MLSTRGEVFPYTDTDHWPAFGVRPHDYQMAYVFAAKMLGTYREKGYLCKEKEVGRKRLRARFRFCKHSVVPHINNYCYFCHGFTNLTENL